ncbi:MAG: fluoride efflux transporter CrcB [Solirubrobacteraceae bacterium]
MSAWVWLSVAVAGGLGAIARFALDSAIGERFGRDFPFGTYAINMSGSLLLGLLSGLAVQGDLLVIVGTATIGSYTTFSTWMLESHRLAEDAETIRAVANVVLSLAVGFGAALLGRTIGASL